MPLKTAGKGQTTRTVKKYYVIEFRKRGKAPAIRIMDVICSKWFVPKTQGKDVLLFCSFPDEPTVKEVADDLDLRLNNNLEANPNWKLYRVKIRGRDGEFYSTGLI